jgi:hypothetical protein
MSPVLDLKGYFNFFRALLPWSWSVASIDWVENLTSRHPTATAWTIVMGIVLFTVLREPNRRTRVGAMAKRGWTRLRESLKHDPPLCLFGDRDEPL